MKKPTIPMIELTPRGLRLKGLLHEMDRTRNAPLTMMKIRQTLGFEHVSEQVVAKRSTEFACAYIVYMTELMNAPIGCPTKEIKLADIAMQDNEESGNAH